MRALYFGTPEIAVPALLALHEIAKVTAVVCQPDKPAGRGLELKPPAVKVKALELGIPVTQPTKIKTPEFAQFVRSQEADVALVMAYGRILPKAVLDAPKRGCMNLHASLLPRHRGAAPINWAIAEGDRETGVCLMQMDEGLDTGPVYARSVVPIEENATAGELADLLARAAADVVRTDLRKALAEELPAIAQEAAKATHARMLEKGDGRIDWTKPARAVHDRARAMTPWPGAFTMLQDKLFKVLVTRVAEGEAGGAPGTVVLATKERIEIACGEGRIAVLKGQMEGKKPLEARDLVAGRTVTLGAKLG